MMDEPVDKTTAHAPSVPPPRRSRSRRFVYAIALVALLGVVSEIGALAALRALDGEWFAYERWAADRNAAIESTPLPDSFRGGAAQRSGPYREVIHPYLGYALELRSAERRQPFEVPTLRIEECAMGSPRRSQGTLLVGLFGGSVAYIFSEEGTARLAAAIRSLDLAKGREVRFVVAAAGGWKQPQQAMALSWMLSIGCELDLLIQLDGFNEVALHAHENAKLNTFPAYPRRWAARIEKLPDAATRLALGRLSVIGEDRIGWAKAFTQGAARFSAVANLLWRARDASLRREVDACVTQLREKPTTTASYLTQGPDYSAASSDATMDDLVATWERSSRLMSELCRAHGIRYFHFLQPNQYVDGSKVLSDEEREKCWKEDQPYRAGVLSGYPRLRATGARLVAEAESFHDLTMVFADVAETLYIDACCHFNRRGNELVADAIAAVLRQELDAK